MTNGNDINLEGKTAVVTGYGGVGYEVALGLVRRGATVIIAGRDRAKGEAAVMKICECVRRPPDTLDTLRPPDIRFEQLDLADSASIKSFAERIATPCERIDIVMCIAGVMMPDELRLSGDGVEYQFAVNYLGHYTLVGLLLPLLRRSDDPRVVTVSSVANRPFRFDLRDAVAAHGYNASLSYALSKLCCLMYAVELAERGGGMEMDGGIESGDSIENDGGIESGDNIENDGGIVSGDNIENDGGIVRNGGIERNSSISVYCCHPGFARTQLFERSKGFVMTLLRVIFFILPIIRQSAHSAALPALYAATSPDAKNGAYYGPMFTIMGLPRRALMPLRAKNARLRAELWEKSEELTGVVYE